MEKQEIDRVLMESARQSMVEILDVETGLGNLLRDLPEPDMVISVVRRQLGLGKDDAIPDDIAVEHIAKISAALKASLGEAVAEAFKEVAKQPKLLKALRKLFSTHSEDFGATEPLLSRRYAEALLDFAERFMDTQDWKRTQSLLIVAEALVKNVTGTARPRLFARMDVDWGIYLWKCGDYSESEKKFNKASAGMAMLLKKHGTEITDPAEMGRNKELQSRLLLGYGVLYGDSLEDKPKAIRYYTESLDILSKLEGSYRNKKRMVSLYNNLGVSYHKMAEMHPEAAEGHMSEALRNFEEGLAIARGIHLTRMVGWILFNAGEIYALLGSLEKAAACSAESRRIFTETIPNDRGLSGVEMLDAVIHTQKKDHRRALDSINRSIELRQRMNEPRRLADAFEMRGDILLALGDMMGARCDYQMAHAIYNSIGSEPGSRRTGDKLAAQGGPDSAG